MSKKKYLILIAPTLAVIGGLFFVWHLSDAKTNAAKLESEILKELTVEELRAVLTTQPETASLASDPEASRVFLKGMREYLALAAQARREGLAEDKNFKINFEYKKQLLLADAFERKMAAESGKPYNASESELSEVWADRSSDQKFQETMDAIAAIQRDAEKQRGSEAPIPKLAGEALEKGRRKWARAQVLSRKANADTAFVNSREMQLRIKILEAGILSSDYLRKYGPSEIKATETEIAAFLAEHPELGETRKKEKAVSLLARINAGEDLAKLAEAESEDRTSKERGGLYEDVSTDLVWPEVEQVALSLTEGKIHPQLVESETGFHIVKLEKKRLVKQPDGSSSYKFSFRHILIQRAFEDPNHHLPGVPAPFVGPRDIAMKSIEREKRDRFVQRIIETAGISVPEGL